MSRQISVVIFYNFAAGRFRRVRAQEAKKRSRLRRDLREFSVGQGIRALSGSFLLDFRTISGTGLPLKRNNNLRSVPAHPPHLKAPEICCPPPARSDHTPQPSRSVHREPRSAATFRPTSTSRPNPTTVPTAPGMNPASIQQRIPTEPRFFTPHGLSRSQSASVIFMVRGDPKP
jgi:hypothetical protein